MNVQNKFEELYDKVKGGQIGRSNNHCKVYKAKMR